MVKKIQLIEKIRAFEKRIGDKFNSKEIKAPIHLYDGNEEKMIDIFRHIDVKNDWICCTWRNHYQALLKGVPEDLLEAEIIKGKSMVMTLPEYKFICSSIVGGIPSIAVGISMGLALDRSSNGGHVWCWVGDMSAETGHFHEAYKFARNYELPITFIVENNNLSVLTPTDETWQREIPYYIDNVDDFEHKMKHLDIYEQPNLLYYEYKNGLYPHAGAGQRVQF
jgi:TPP-dependent pyruvate/acetoin dehydrogenase alpha subunit